MWAIIKLIDPWNEKYTYKIPKTTLVHIQQISTYWYHQCHDYIIDLFRSQYISASCSHHVIEVSDYELHVSSLASPTR